MVKAAQTKFFTEFGHGEVDLEGITELVKDKCGAQATYVDARRTSP
jgi:hypothetical protein